MSAPGEEAEKPHEPTPKRLEEARRKGEVPRSMDLSAAAVYGGMLLTGIALGAVTLHQSGEALLILLDQSDRLAPLVLSDGGRSLAGGLMARLGFGLAPWFVIPAVMALAVLIAQRAVVFAPTKLAPKLSRVSPVANFRNRFGRNGLFEFAKSMTKLIVFSIVLAVFLSAELPRLMASIYLSPGGATVLLGQLTLRFLFLVFVVALIIGAIDFMWQRAEHMRRHRMSHQELRDETKQTEGDPHLKQERRQRGYDIATNRMMADVPTADVVIVNPEHYAVALSWSRKRGDAPVCVAKGVDEIAARIREAALEASVPIRRDAPTARSLHATVAVGEEIPREQYAAVAAAIRFAERMRASQKRYRHDPI